MSLTKKSLKEAQEYVLHILKAGLIPYISGSPGLGKSAMISEVAKEYNLKLIDIRLAQEDPTSLQGFPCLDDTRSKYLPPITFPLQDFDKVPEGYSGWLIFFDELTSAPRSTLSACYKILLDRMIGEHKLHDKCVMVAAGNLLDDGAIVNEMGTALRSRLIHIHVRSDAKDYIDFATRAKFDSRIISYLAYSNTSMNTFEKFKHLSTTDETFACERTWEFVNKLLKQISPNQSEAISSDHTDLLCGTIGSTAHEFVAFTQAFNELPVFKDILANPTKCIVPVEPSIKYLLMGMLVSNATLENIDKIMDYISRFTKEYSFIFIKMLWSKNAKFIENKKVEKLFSEIGNFLLN